MDIGLMTDIPWHTALVAPAKPIITHKFAWRVTSVYHDEGVPDVGNKVNMAAQATRTSPRQMRMQFDTAHAGKAI